MKAQTLYGRACHVLGVREGAIKLVGPAEWKAQTGRGVSRNLGYANQNYVQSRGDDPVVYVRRGQPLSTYIHELLHHLFPSRPHWWHFVAAAKLAGETVDPAYRYGYGHGAVLGVRKVESKAKLRQLAATAAKRRGWGGE